MNLMKTTSWMSALLLATTVSLAHAQDASPAPPSAPLPSALATAHKLFLGNAGDQENADCLRSYDVLYAGLQNLRRFELVTDPAQADLVLEMHYEFSFGAGINEGNNTPRQFRLVLIDPHTHIVLWSLTERSNYAIFQKNRDKNLDQTVGTLVNDFDVLMQPTPTPPNNHSVAHH